MIKIKAKGANIIPGVMGGCEVELPINKKRIWIGRGQQVLQKEDSNNYVFNLAELSRGVSRVHAYIAVSPAFFSEPKHFSSYLLKLGSLWATLPPATLFTIWQFVRPAKKILLKDNHSKTGLFRKITKAAVNQGSEIVFGDCRPLIFQHQERHDSQQIARIRIQHLREQQYVILNAEHIHKVDSFWIACMKNQHFILLNYPGKVFVGRSSGCNLSIPEASVSRKHATLQFKDGQWLIFDGDGVSASSNGVWQRTKRIQLSFRDCQKGEIAGQTAAKVGDVLLSFTIQQDFSGLGLSGVSSFNKGQMDTSLTSLLHKWVNEEPTLASGQIKQR